MLENTALKEILYEKLVNSPEDALVTATLYPASAAFIDVSRYIRWGFKIYAGGLDSATTCQVQQDTAATSTNLKDITGAVVVIGTAGDDNVYGVECHRDMVDMENDFKFVTLEVTGPAGGNDYGCIVFWGIPDEYPAAQEAGTDITLLSPAQA